MSLREEDGDLYVWNVAQTMTALRRQGKSGELVLHLHFRFDPDERGNTPSPASLVLDRALASDLVRRLQDHLDDPSFR